ncbi:MAG: replicative DNA helicase, partial [Treponema sp.]|nr:replicative DNA helicase [Treponema sp.]
MAAPGLKDRIPPHNDEAEKATLGALLLDADAVNTVSYLRPDYFYSNANRRVFEAVQNLSGASRRADIITVVEELRRTGELDAAGGPAYVASLTNVVPTAANVDYYAGIVLDGFIRRALIRVSQQATADAFDESRDSRTLLDETQQKIFELTDSRQPMSFKTLEEIVPDVYKKIEARLKNKGAYTGVPSGFDDLDQMTSGFQPSELVILGARPSVGKTALALSMASNMAVHQNRPVAFFSLEMSAQTLVERLISGEANMDSQAIKTGYFKASELNKILDAAGRLYEAPLYIEDLSNMKLLDLRSQARRIRSQKKVEIIFIDYLGLISSEHYQLPRYEQMAEVSRSLKSLARELDVPIVALCQVGRDVEKRRERPNLADIRDTGSIEQDADVVMFLHRKRESDKKADDASRQDAEGKETSLILAKQRNGPVGTVDLMFKSAY